MRSPNILKANQAKNIFIFSFTCIALASCAGKTSEEALETKELLDKLQTKTEVGINQKEYGNAFADIKYAYKQIEKEKEKEAFEKLIQIHEVTYAFWKGCYSHRYTYNCPTEGQPMQLVLTSFPEIQNKEQDYAQKYSTGRTVWNTQSVISELWTIADRELENLEL